MKKIVISMLCFAICNQAMAVDWYEVATNSDESMTVYVDLDSVAETRINGSNYLMLVTKYDFAKSHKLFKEQGIVTRKTQDYISCRNQSYFVKSSVSYDKQNKILDSYKSPIFPLEQNFDYAFPETIMSGVIDIGCGFYYPNEYAKRMRKLSGFRPPARVCKHLTGEESARCSISLLQGE